jgi:hypothetical protein
MEQKYVKFIPLFMIGGVAMGILGGFIIKWLWNWLTPALWGWPMITFWQAWGLLILCRILFGRMGMAHGGGGRRWMSRRERFQHMSPEEKARFKKKIMDRWGISDEPAGSGS